MSSYNVVKSLKDEGLLRSIKLVDVSNDLGVITELGLLSVPAISKDGKILGIDPLEPDFVKALLTGDEVTIEKYVPKSYSEALDRFSVSLIHSSYASILALIHNSIDPLLNTKFIDHAVRLELVSSLSKDKLIEEIKLRSRDIFESLKDKMVRVAAKNYLREVVWILGIDVDELTLKKYIDRDLITQWLLAKASVGRVLVPYNFDIVKDVATHVVNVLTNRLSKYLKDLIEEYRTLMREFVHRELE